MLVYAVRIVSIGRLVRRTFNKSKWAAEELVIVYFFDIEFFSTSVVGTCYHSHIIHLGR